MFLCVEYVQIDIYQVFVYLISFKFVSLLSLISILVADL